jgi:hypothetical protein
LTIATVLLGINEEEYVPDYDSDVDLDPNNLPGEQEHLEKYRKIALMSTQPRAVEGHVERPNRNRQKDMAAELKKLGLEVPNDPKRRNNSKPQAKPQAWTKWTAGKGKKR